MKRIFITTNWIQLHDDVLGSVNDINNNFKGIDNLYKANANTVLFYSIADKIFQPQLLIDADIILIHDRSYIDVIRQFGIDQETDYLLYHSKPDKCTYDEFSKNKKTQGRHELHDNKYVKVFNIIFDGENNKAQRIIDYLFPPENNILEAKLILLHKCLTPEGAKVVKGELDKHLGYFKDIKDDVKKINHNGKTVVEHLSEQTNCFDEDNYIKPLSKLRDALLPE